MAADAPCTECAFYSRVRDGEGARFQRAVLFDRPEGRRRQGSDLDSLMVAFEQKVLVSNAALERRERDIAGLRQELAEVRGKVAEQEAVVHARDEEIERLSRALEERRHEATRLQADVVSLAGSVTERDTVLVEWEQTLDELDHIIRSSGTQEGSAVPVARRSPEAPARVNPELRTTR